MHEEGNLDLHFEPTHGATGAARVFLRTFCEISELRDAAMIPQVATES